MAIHMTSIREAADSLISAPPIIKNVPTADEIHLLKEKGIKFIFARSANGSTIGIRLCSRTRSDCIEIATEFSHLQNRIPIPFSIQHVHLC